MSADATWPWARHFEADGIYLATATAGLPPRATADALDAITDAWRHGRFDGAAVDADVEATREAYARFVKVDPSWVAAGPQASPMVGLVASSLPDGARVLVPAGEFTSVTFPFAAHADRGVQVIEVPLAELALHIDDRTSLVALAAVQSADGAVADLDAITLAADRHGVDVLLDVTQAAGWLPIDASRFAYTVCSAYKWLLHPRGTTLFTVHPERLERLRPTAANWYAGDDRWNSIYGLPLRLAPDARRFDVSPAWFSWVGARASMDFLHDVGREALHAHAIAVADAFADAAELPRRASAIRSLTTADGVDALLREHDVCASVRAGRLRLAFHVNNTVEEGHRVGALLRGRVQD